MKINKEDVEKKISNSLRKYICDICGSKEILEDVIERTGIQTLLPYENTIMNYTLSLEHKSAVLFFKQKKRNQLYLKEIQCLLKRAEENSLVLVFLKGIFLAKELYANYDIRLSDDIDILIDTEHEKEWRLLLKEAGYTIQKDCDINFSHVVFTKQVNGSLITLEVHGHIINPPFLFTDFTKLFFNNLNCINYNGNKVYILKKEFNLIYLILNFYKSLPFYYFENSLYMRKTIIYVSKLHDIALLILKEKIEWRNVIYIGQKTKTIRFIYLVLKYINEIYENIVPNEIMYELLYDRSETYISNRKMEVLGQGKFSWLFQQIYNKLEDCNLSDLIFSKLPVSFHLLDYISGDRIFLNQYYFKEYHLDMGNGEDTDIKIALKVTEAGLNVHLNATNKTCCLYNGEGEFYDKDGIEIIVLLDKCIMHRMFTLNKSEDKVNVLRTSYNDKNICFENKNYNFSFESHTNGFDMKLFVSWREFDLFDLKKKVAIEVAALVSNPVFEKINCQCSVFENNKDIWNFKGTKILDCEI